MSGIGVGKVYLYNRKLTNKAFVYIGGKKFYKTGDLGRFLNDGNIELLVLGSNFYLIYEFEY